MVHLINVHCANPVRRAHQILFRVPGKIATVEKPEVTVLEHQHDAVPVVGGVSLLLASIRALGVLWHRFPPSMIELLLCRQTADRKLLRPLGLFETEDRAGNNGAASLAF